MLFLAGFVAAVPLGFLLGVIGMGSWLLLKAGLVGLFRFGMKLLSGV